MLEKLVFGSPQWRPRDAGIGDIIMLDLLFIGIGVGAFAIAVAYTHGCEKLRARKS
jgi:hypothetical protein